MRLFIFLSISILFARCASPDLTENPDISMNDSASKTVQINPNYQEENHSSGVPPFSDTCNCNFEIIDDMRTDLHKVERIICGKGWNPNSESCSWTWGELISNALPPDSGITDFRVHLVDLFPSEVILSAEFLKSKKFQSSIISTSISNPSEPLCIFDPNKTGKYSKPKYWN